MAGDEVAQVYVSGPAAGSNTGPLRSLKAFKRIHLKPGETKTVEFVISPDAFSFMDEKNGRTVLPGKYEIAVGGGQPDSRIKTNSNVVKAGIIITPE